MSIPCDRFPRILDCIVSAGILLLHGSVQGADATEVLVNIDRTTQAWSDLAMGAPSSEDDADQSRAAKAVFSYVPAYGRPHADAGAQGLNLPRLNDGKSAANGDDPAHSTWFDIRASLQFELSPGAQMKIEHADR